MRAWLHPFVLLAVVVVFGASFALLSTVIGITSPWLALLLMFYFLGIAKAAEPLFMLRMPRALYPIRHWEQHGRVLQRLGVFAFGKLLRHTPLRHLNSRVYLVPNGRNPLKVFRQAESAEATHFWAAVLLTPFIALAAVTGRWNFVLWSSLTQLFVNVYPILHLRHARGRLARAIRARK